MMIARSTWEGTGRWMLVLVALPFAAQAAWTADDQPTEAKPSITKAEDDGNAEHRPVAASQPTTRPSREELFRNQREAREAARRANERRAAESQPAGALPSPTTQPGKPVLPPTANPAAGPGKSVSPLPPSAAPAVPVKPGESAHSGEHSPPAAPPTGVAVTQPPVPAGQPPTPQPPKAESSKGDESKPDEAKPAEQPAPKPSAPISPAAAPGGNDPQDAAARLAALRDAARASTQQAIKDGQPATPGAKPVVPPVRPTPDHPTPATGKTVPPPAPSGVKPAPGAAHPTPAHPTPAKPSATHAGGDTHIVVGEPTTQSADDATEWFNYEGVPWEQVLKDFAERLGMPWMNADESPVTGDLTYVNPRKFTPADAVDELNLLLHEKGYRFVDVAGHLYVVPISELPQYLTVDRIFESVEALERAKLRDMDYACVYVQILKQPAQKIVEMFGDSLPDYTRISAVADTNKIRLMALARDIRKFLILKDRIDISPLDPGEIKLFTIKSNVREMEQMVRTMVGASQPQRRFNPQTRQWEQAGPGEESVKIVADDRTNTLIVKGTQETLDRIDTVLKQLDIKIDLGDFKTVVIPVEHGNATEIAALINQILQQEQGGQVPPWQRRPQPGQPAQPVQPGQPQPPQPQPQPVAQGGVQNQFGLVEDIYERARKAIRLVADDRTNSLIVYANADGVKRVRDMLQEIDLELPSNLRTFKLKNAQADDVYPVLNQMVQDLRTGGRGVGGRAPTIAVDAPHNALIVMAEREAMKRIEDFIAVLDTVAEQAPRHVIQLVNLLPSTVAPTVQSLIEGAVSGPISAPRRGGGPGRPPGGGTRISGASTGQVLALDEAKTLIVWCDDDKWQKVEETLLMWDAAAVSDTPVLREFVIEKGDAGSIANTLTNLYRTYQHPTLGRSQVNISADGSTIYVQAVTPALEEIAALVAKLDNEPESDPLVILPLACADASQVAQLVQPLLNAGRSAPGVARSAGSVQAEGTTNSLVVRADKFTLEKIKDFAADLDKKQCAQAPERRFYTLKNAQPREIADAIVQAMNRGGGSGFGRGFGGTPSGQVKAVAAGAQVMVEAPMEKFTEIETLIDKMDDPGGSEVVIKVLKVPGADVQAIAGRLNNAFRTKYRNRPTTTVSFEGDQNAETLTITASRDLWPEIDVLLADIKKASEELVAQNVVIETRKLSGLDLANLTTLLTQSFSNRPARPDKLKPSFQSDRLTETLLITAPKDMMPEITALISKFEAEARELAPEQKFITLKNADATAVAEQLQKSLVQQVTRVKGQAVADRISILADARLNQLVINAPKFALESAEGLIAELDTADANDTAPATIEIKYLDPNQLVTVINQMYGGGARGGRSAGASQDVQATVSGTKVVIKAPARKLEEIREMIAKMDVEAPPLEVRSYQLKVLDATQVALAVQGALFASGVQAKPGQMKPGAYPEPNTNSLLVMAPKEQIPYIDGLIQQFETIELAGSQVKAYTLKNARADSVSQNVDAMLKAKVAEKGRKQSSIQTSVVADPTTNRLFVLAPDDMQDLAAQLIAMVDKEVGAGDIVRIIQLDSAEATELALTLNQVMQTGGGKNAVSRVRITADEGSNSLLLAGLPKDVNEYEKIVSDLVADGGSATPELRIVRLENASAVDLAEKMQTIFPVGRSPSDSVTVTEDEAYNRLIITANKRKMKQVLAYIAQLDANPSEGLEPGTMVGGKRLHFVTVLRGDPVDIAWDVSDLFPSEDKGGPKIDASWDGDYIKVICRDSEFAAIEKAIRDFDERAKVERSIVTVKPHGDVKKLIEYFKAKNPEIVINSLPDADKPTETIVESLWTESEVPPWVQEQKRRSEKENGKVKPAAGNGDVQPFGMDRAALDSFLKQIDREIPRPDGRAVAPLAEGSARVLPADERTVAAQRTPAGGVALGAQVEPQDSRSKTARSGDDVPRAFDPSVRAAAQPTDEPAKPARPEAGKPVQPTAAPGKAPKTDAPKPDAPKADPKPVADGKLEREQPQVLLGPDGQMIISGPKSAVGDVQDLIEAFEKDMAAGEVIRIFKFKYGDVAAAANIVNLMFNDRQQPQAPQQPQQAQRPGAERGKEGEKNDKEGGSIQERMAEMLGRQQQQRGGRQQGGQRVRLATDPGHNYMIVKCDAADLPELRKLLRELDIPPGQVDLKVIQLKHLDATETANNIKDVLGINRAPRGGAARGPQAQPGGNPQNPQQQQLMQILQQQMVVDMPGAEGGAKIDSVEIVPNVITNSLMVSAPPDVMKVIQDTIGKLEDLEGRDVVVIRHYQLEKAKVDDILPLLQEIFSSAAGSGGGAALPGGPGRGAMRGSPASLGPVSVSGDPRSNTLLFTAQTKDVPLVEAQIEMLDIEGAVAAGEIYVCQFGDAASIAGMVEAIYGSAAGGAGGLRPEGRRGAAGAGTQVKIEAEPATNAILVWAPRGQREIIFAKIKELDDLGRRDVHEILVKFADPETLAEKLQGMFGSAGGGGGGGEGGRRRGAGGAGQTGGRVMIVGDSGSKKLLVRAPENILRQIEDVVDTLDVANEQLQIKRFQLVHANAEVVVDSVKSSMLEFMAQMKQSNPNFKLDPFTAVPDPRTNSIVVVGSPQTFVFVQSLVDEIEKPAAPEMQKTFEVFVLQTADAQTVADAVNAQSMTGAAGGGPSPRRGGMGGSRGGASAASAGELNVTATADLTTNSVMVYGTRADIEKVRTMIIEPLDGIGNEPPMSIAVKNAEPSQIVSFIQQFLPHPDSGQAGRGGARRAPVVVPNDAAKTIIVRGTAAEMERIRTLIERFDDPAVVSQQMNIVQVPLGQDAVALSRELERVVNQAEQQSARVEGREPRQVSLGADDYTNSIIIYGNPSAYGLVKAAVAQLGDIKTSNPVTRVITFSNLSADEAAQMIQDLQQSRKGGGGGASSGRRGGTSGGAMRGGALPASSPPAIAPGGGGRNFPAPGNSPQPGGFQPQQPRRNPPTTPPTGPRNAPRNPGGNRDEKPGASRWAPSDGARYACVDSAKAGPFVGLTLFAPGSLVALLRQDADDEGVEEVDAATLLRDLGKRANDNRPPDSKRGPTTLPAADPKKNGKAKGATQPAGSQPARPPKAAAAKDAAKSADAAAKKVAAAPATRAAARPTADEAQPMPSKPQPATRAAVMRDEQPRPPAPEGAQDEQPTTAEAAAERPDESGPIEQEPPTTQPMQSVTGSLKGDVVATPIDSQRLVITGDENDIAFIEQILRSMEHSAPKPRIEVFSLKHAKAAALAQALQQTVQALIQSQVRSPGAADRVNIAAEARSNSLIVSASEKNMEMIQGLIAKLDTDKGGEAAQFKAVPVHNVRASEAAAQIAPIIQRLNTQREIPADAQAVVQADDRSNTIVIVGTATDIEEIEGLIDTVDVEIKADDPRSFVRGDMIIISLKNAIATDVAKTLADLIEAEQTAAREGASTGAAGPGGAARAAGKLAVRKLHLTTSDGRELPELDLELPIKILPEKGTNSVIIYSNPKNNEALKEIVGVFDTLPIGAETDVRAFVLKYAAAEQISELLKKVFDEGKKALKRPAEGSGEGLEKGILPPIPPDLAGKGLPYNVILNFDARSNTVFVIGRKDAVLLAGGLISELDKPSLELSVKSHVLGLRNLQASAMAKKLTDLLEKRTKAIAGDKNVGRDSAVVMPDDRSNTLIIVATDEMFEMVEDLVGQLDSANSYRVVDTRVHPLGYGDAKKLQGLVQEVFDRKKEARTQAGAQDAGDSKDALFVTADTRSNSLILTGTRDYLEEAVGLIRNLDQRFDPTVVFKIRPVKLNSAANISSLIKDMIDKSKTTQGGGDAKLSGTPIYIASDPLSDSLLLAASQEDMVMLDHWIDALDRPTEIGRMQKIIPIARGSAEDISKSVGELFKRPSGGGTSGGGGGSDVTVTFDAITNSVVAVGPPAVLQDIEALVRGMDEIDPRAGREVRIFKLKQADAQSAGDLLTNILEGRGGSVGGQRSGGGGSSSGGGAGTREDAARQIMLIYQQKHSGSADATLRAMRADVRVTADLRTNSLVIVAPTESMELMESLIVAVDVPPDAAKIRVFPLLNADAQQMVDTLQQLFTGSSTGSSNTGSRGGTTAGGGTQAEGERRLVLEGGAGELGGREELSFTTDARTNAVIAAGTKGYLDLVEELIVELDRQPIEERKTMIYQPKYNAALSLVTSIKDYNSAEKTRLEELGDEISKQRKTEREIVAIANEDANMVILGYNPRLESDVMKIMQDLDQPPPQVMIQVLILEVTMDSSLELGVEFAFQDLQYTKAGPTDTTTFDYVGGTDVGAAGTGLGGFTFTITGQDFNFLLRTLQNQGSLRVLSRPQIVAMDNQEASIKITNDVPYVNGTSTTTGGQITTTVAREDVGIELTVTPQINPDGYVRMEIEQIVSDFTGSTVEVGQGITAPVFFKREAKTQVTVRDNETVVLGGLIQSRDENREQKVPILGDIPLIGVLFRNQEDTTRRSELLIILTPQVVRTMEDYRTLSEVERDRNGVIPPDVLSNPLMQGLRVRPERPPLDLPPIRDEKIAPAPNGSGPNGPVPNGNDYGPTPSSGGDGDANSYDVPITVRTK